MKINKKILTLVLAIAMLFAFAVQSFAVNESFWWKIWGSSESITMFVGSNESERNFSWYSDYESYPTDERCPKVIISTNKDLTSSQIFKGYCTEAVRRVVDDTTIIENGYVNKVTVTDLKENTTYYYQCKSENFESDIYSFKTDSKSEFSAMYVTDVHITAIDDANENSLSDTSYRFHQTLEDALEKNKNISLLLSAGDQATEGLESEYKAFSVSPLLRGISVATAMGNHDRKGGAYKLFKNVPNEDEEALIHSYNGTDYWFTKGEALFLVMDSNSGNAMAHADFVKRAIKANPDVKWKIMMFHHDLYSGRIEHRESENNLLRTIWGPIADEFGIDLVLLGHSHYYTITDVLYKNVRVEKLQKEMVDPKGTIYAVSCSLGRPRDDDDLGLNEEWIGAEYLTDTATYFILDFKSDSITVNSYELGGETPINSFTIKKTSQNGGHEDTGFFTSIKDGIVRFLGAIYTIFNNFNSCDDLKEHGYDAELSDFFGTN